MKRFKISIRFIALLALLFLLPSCYTQFSPPPGERSSAPRGYSQEEPEEEYAESGESDEYDKYDEEYYDEGDIALAEGNGYYFYEGDEGGLYGDYGYDRYYDSPHFVPDVNLTIWHHGSYYPRNYRFRGPYYRYGNYYSPYYSSYLYCSWDPYWDPWYVTSCPPYYWSSYYDPYYYGGYGYYGRGYGHRYGSYAHSSRNRKNFDFKRRDWERRDVASTGSSRRTNRSPGTVGSTSTTTGGRFGTSNPGYIPVTSAGNGSVGDGRPVRSGGSAETQAGVPLEDRVGEGRTTVRKRSSASTGKKQPRRNYRRSGRTSGERGRVANSGSDNSDSGNGNVRSTRPSNNNSGSVRSSGSSNRRSSGSSGVRSNRGSTKKSGSSGVRSSGSSTRKSGSSARSPRRSSSSGKSSSVRSSGSKSRSSSGRSSKSSSSSRSSSKKSSSSSRGNR